MNSSKNGSKVPILRATRKLFSKKQSSTGEWTLLVIASNFLNISLSIKSKMNLMMKWKELKLKVNLSYKILNLKMKNKKPISKIKIK